MYFKSKNKKTNTAKYGIFLDLCQKNDIEFSGVMLYNVIVRL